MKTNVAMKQEPKFTHGGAKASQQTKLQELKRSVLTCMLWEDSYYESGNDQATRISTLVLDPKIKPEDVCALAIEARSVMGLRHVPLYLISELCYRKDIKNWSLIEETLSKVIQRADELTEFLAIYWKNKGAIAGKKRSLRKCVQRGLSTAFGKFGEYQLAKYDRDGAVKLRDVLRICHPKPQDEIQAQLWKKVLDRTLTTPDTWETELSAGKDKKATFERLMREKKLGGLATLRNLRNMIQAGVDSNLIRERLASGIARAMPFQFIQAAKFAPGFQDEIQQSMFNCFAELEKIDGTTAILIDVSGSMDSKLSAKSEALRLEAACGLAACLRERCKYVKVATFSNHLVEVPNSRGFALINDVVKSQMHSGTELVGSVNRFVRKNKDLNRVIVITDEQATDVGRLNQAQIPSYIMNVGGYKNGIGNTNGWVTISGWSDRLVDYILELERQPE